MIKNKFGDLLEWYESVAVLENCSIEQVLEIYFLSFKENISKEQLERCATNWWKSLNYEQKLAILSNYIESEQNDYISIFKDKFNIK